MAMITMSDYIPRMEAAGLSVTIESFAVTTMDLGAFLAALVTAISPQQINESMLLAYIADTLYAGKLSSMIVVSGVEMPPPAERGEAPAGIGQDAAGIWFSTPATGVRDVLWYVNGTLRLRQVGVDLSVARSATKLALACKKDDVIQVATVYNNVVSWFGKIIAS